RRNLREQSPATRPSPCPLPALRGEGGRRPGEGLNVTEPIANVSGRVAAGVPPAGEPGILPGGTISRPPPDARRFPEPLERQTRFSVRQDAALYGSQDGCRYDQHTPFDKPVHTASRRPWPNRLRRRFP